MIPRGGLQGNGYEIAQFFDGADLADGTSYDYTFNRLTNIPGQYAARYKYFMNGSNLFDIEVVDGTVGPWGGKICLPPNDHGARNAAEWVHAFVGKVTDTGPLMVQPINSGDDSGWTADDDLASVPAFSSKVGADPGVDDYVLCVRGTHLGKQVILAFQGGGGSSLIPFKITGGSNPYNASELDLVGDPTGGTLKSSGITTTALYEINGSTVLIADTRVYAQAEGPAYCIVLPMKVCTPA